MQNLLLLPAPLLPALEVGATLGGSPGPDLSRYFLVCTLLITLTLGVAWGLRKLVAGNLKLRASQRSLRVVDVLAMGNRRKLAVVRCYDRTFVLGLGDKEICAIAELDSVIGSQEVVSPARKSDQGAFAQALEQLQRVLPEKPAVQGGVQAGGSPLPALSRKPLRHEQQVKAAAPAAAPVELIEAPRAAAQPKVQRKRVRRKLARRVAVDPAARQREAEAVASAAMQIAREKRRAQADSQAASQSVAKPAQAANKPMPQAPKSLPRLEGILG